MKTVFSCFALLLVLFSCTRETHDVLELPANGKIRGQAVLVENNNFYAYNASQGIKVSIEGTGMTTITDSAGLYSFNNLPFGSYTVSFSKPGYGSTKIFNLSCYGNGEVDVNRTLVCKYPAYGFYHLLPSSYSIGKPSGDTSYHLTLDIFCKDEVGTTIDNISAILAFGLEKDFTLDDKSCLYFTQLNYINPNSATGLNIEYTEFVKIIKYWRLYMKGQKIYLKAYPYNSYSGYTDLARGKMIHAAIGTPATTSFIIQ